MNIYLGLNMWDCITIGILGLLLCFTALGISASNNERRVKIAQAQAAAEGIVLDEPDERREVVGLAEVKHEPGTGKHRALAADRAEAVKALSKTLFTDAGEKKSKKKSKKVEVVNLRTGEITEADPQEGINQTGRWAD